MLVHTKGKALFSRKFGNIGVLLVDWRGVRCGIYESHEREKMIYKENTEQKMSVRIKRCGINKKPTFIWGLSTEWYFWKTPL